MLKMNLFLKNSFVFLGLVLYKNYENSLEKLFDYIPQLRFLAFQNSLWSSKYDQIHGSDSKFKFLFQNKGLHLWVVWAFSPLIFAKKILMFETFSRP